MGRFWGIAAAGIGILAAGAAVAAGNEIEGAVHDALGRPIPGAAVALKGSDGHEVARSVSDATGHFTFSSVPAGVYSIEATEKDFEAATAIVNAGATAAKTDLVMKTKTGLDVAVTAKRLDEARNALSPTTGTNSYRVDSAAVEDLPQGADTPFNKVLLQTPGAAQDSYGQIHLRGEHANLQYRINDVLLPEGITGFGQVIDTRIADSVELLDGALPAQYGYRTSGVVDITTKSGAFANGGRAEMYGGSWGTVQPSIEYGGSAGPLNYFVSGDYLRSGLGVEPPTSGTHPIHDNTLQQKGFGYFTYEATPFARVNLITGTSIGRFQIPNNPGQAPGYTLAGASVEASGGLNENQTEENHYATLALQGTSEDGNIGYQIAPYVRYTNLHFYPDQIGDLEYNGVASDVVRSNLATGLQGDGSYFLNNQHTLRAGFVIQHEHAIADNTSQVFPVVGGVTGTTPKTVVDDNSKTGMLYGMYLQDEWRLTKKLTLNYGGRFDAVNAYVNETQLSPRIGLVYRATETTTLHAGYARYFTPPPLELVAPTSIAKFANTSNAPTITQNDPVRSERSNDYDIGVDQKVGDHLRFGVDAYYKDVTNLLDEGQFGAALVFTPFNYAEGRIVGTEFTANYTEQKVNAYLNFAVSHAVGKNVISSQANFSDDQTELDYAKNNWINLDHDQLYTMSGGASYQVFSDTRVSLTGIMGSGLRRGFANTGHLPVYMQFDLGATYHLAAFDSKGLDFRLSVVNLFDQAYELRDGTGIGVGAPQWGPRRGYFLGISRAF
jgi:outer membrane receptor protein involved in Fe transport